MSISRVPSSRDEVFYRKWMGICQMFEAGPLVLTQDNLKDEVVIRLIKDKEDVILLRMNKERFAELTANEIVELIGDSE
jgi:hypothetical protein